MMKDMNRCDLLLQYNFTFQHNMNRQLNCMISRSGDSAGTLAEELVLHGFIQKRLAEKIEHSIHDYSQIKNLYPIQQQDA